MKIYKNARILTLAEKGLIESGVVVVDGAKIAGVYDVAEFDATQYPRGHRSWRKIRDARINQRPPS